MGGARRDRPCAADPRPARRALLFRRRSAQLRHTGSAPWGPDGHRVRDRQP